MIFFFNYVRVCMFSCLFVHACVCESLCCVRCYSHCYKIPCPHVPNMEYIRLRKKCVKFYPNRYFNLILQYSMYLMLFLFLFLLIYWYFCVLLLLLLLLLPLFYFLLPFLFCIFRYFTFNYLHICLGCLCV